tara:strand:+ start:1316 stop:1792 length:477 start_codon:yes stop_codon:yes gene_type:complete
MTQVDYVVLAVEVSKRAKFSLDDLYSVLKKWFEENEYLITEKEYFDTGDGGLRIKWESRKEIDDYHAYNIDVTVKGKGLKKVEDEKEPLVEGDISVSFDAFVESDIPGSWSSPFRNFLREFYDKYIRGESTDKTKQELVDETYEMVNKTRVFLRHNEF